MLPNNKRSKYEFTFMKPCIKKGIKDKKDCSTKITSIILYLMFVIMPVSE